MTIDLASDPVVRNFLQEVLQTQSDVPQDVVDFIMNKPALHIPITMACALFTSNKVNLRNAQTPERDVLRDAYFIAAILRLLERRLSRRDGA